MVNEDHNRRSSDWAHIDRLAWRSDPRSRIPENERIAALEELLAIHRTQVEEFRREERTEIDRPLISHLMSFGLRIFAQHDPLTAMAEFLGRKRKRGKRSKNNDRDFGIAVRVVEKALDGMRLEAAIALLSNELHLSPERTANIYKAHRKAARAEVALRIQNSTPDPSDSSQTPGSPEGNAAD